MDKISIGNDMIDKMLLGGLFKGSSSLVAGATGTGKSLLSIQFISEGLRENVPCLYAGFEESREQIIRNAKSFGIDFEASERKGLLTIRATYPSEKYIEEHLADIKELVENDLLPTLKGWGIPCNSVVFCLV